MGRVGRPNELANMAAFLMSDEVSYINGEVIAIGAAGHHGQRHLLNMMAYSERRLAPHPASRSSRPMRRTKPGVISRAVSSAIYLARCNV